MREGENCANWGTRMHDCVDQKIMDIRRLATSL